MAKFNPNDFLECHVNDAVNVMKCLKVAFPWFSEVHENFWELLFYSVVLHDLGKCCIGFQESGAKGRLWGYRHEILSTAFTQFLDFKENERNAIALSIATHHKYLSDLPLPTRNEEVVWEVYLEKVDELLKNSDYIEEVFIPKIPYWEYYVFGKLLRRFKLSADWKERIKEFDFDSIEKWYEKNWNTQRKLLIFLKGLLNACDHLSSAGETSLRLLPSIVETISLKLPKENWRPLQKLAGNIKSNLILRAPTGYGKTEASLLWANSNGYKIKEKISNRIFYILPYKASINAMHDRLLSYFRTPEIVGILHSSSSYYLYFSNFEYRRLSSLYRKIFTPLKVTTPFQIMKAFFGVGFFEMTFSELNRSILIFDEIHSYEPNILGIILAILEELKNYRVKTMIMSATLPDFVEELFANIIGPKTLKIPGKEADKFTRHIVQIVEGCIDDNIFNFAEKFKKEELIPALIVCNTVDKAVEVYKTLKGARYKVLLLHSRFTYGDREEYERTLRKNMSSYDFVVATQVVEVSLDISFNTILTEPAPLDALIQRFGRVNRKGWIDNRKVNVYVLTQGSEKDEKVYTPYSVVEKSTKILSELNGQELKESIVPELVSSAYEPVKEELLKKIEECRKTALELFEGLKPLKKTESEEEFYKMFRGLEVVPIKFRDKVEELVKFGRGIEIYKYLVPIPHWKYFALQNKLGDVFEYDKKCRVVFASLKYSHEFGLTDELEGSSEIL